MNQLRWVVSLHKQSKWVNSAPKCFKATFSLHTEKAYFIVKRHGLFDQITTPRFYTFLLSNIIKKIPLALRKAMAVEEFNTFEKLHVLNLVYQGNSIIKKISAIFHWKSQSYWTNLFQISLVHSVQHKLSAPQNLCKAKFNNKSHLSSQLKHSYMINRKSQPCIFLEMVGIKRWCLH